MRTLKVIVKNYSATNLQVCLVQKGVKVNWGNAKYTYWDVAPLPAGNGSNAGRTEFYLQESLQFVTATSNGQHYKVTSVMDADPNGANAIKVSFHQQSGSLYFSQPPMNQPGNTLRLDTDASLPPFGDNGTVGIGMNGSAVVLLNNVAPNMRYEFIPGYEYYICISPNASAGDVVPDNAHLTRIDFDGTSTMYATFTANNQWTISSRDMVATEM